MLICLFCRTVSTISFFPEVGAEARASSKPAILEVKVQLELRRQYFSVNLAAKLEREFEKVHALI